MFFGRNMSTFTGLAAAFCMVRERNHHGQAVDSRVEIRQAIFVDLEKMEETWKRIKNSVS